jgi:P4 family phage/plasmid primase-like protien
LHCYWLLKKTVDAQKKQKKVEQALRIIVKAVNGDKSRTDISSLLRLPGTINIKPDYDNVRCKIEYMNLTKKITLADILTLEPEIKVDEEAWKTKGLIELKRAIVQGNRDQGAFDYVRAYVRKYGKRTDNKKLNKQVCKVLNKAGGDNLKAIKKKVPQWIEEARQSDESSEKYSPLELAQLIIDHYDGKIIFMNQIFMIYKKGYWTEVTEEDLRKRIANADIPNTSAARTSGALLNIRDLQTAKESELNSNLICMENGTLDPETGELRGHSPIPRLRNKIPATWDSDAKCLLWLETLEQIFRKDKDAKTKILLLQMFFGYCLVRDTSQAKFLWLVGEGANGKSLILEILSEVVGRDNISRAMLHRLDQSHVRAQLKNKLLNISTEMRADDTISDGYLKAIVSGDPIEADLKFKPSCTFKPYARIVASTNDLPRLLDHSHGFDRRAIILTFNRIFKEKEQDRGLQKKLLKELSGILLWSVNGLKKLRKKGSFKIPSSSKKALREYRKDSDPVKQFVDEKLQVAEKGELTSAVIFTQYNNWRSERGYGLMNISTFGKRLKGLGFDKRSTNGKSVWRLQWQGGRPVTWPSKKGIELDDDDI